MKKMTRRLALASIVALPFAYMGGRKVLALSADPTGPKSCIPADGVQPVTEATDLPRLLRGGFIDDVSCLNATAIHGTVQVKSVEDIQAAIAYARANNLRISATGARHSMGGQAFARGNLILDMTAFNAITLNEREKTVTVEAGATWHDIQNRIHPRFAVKAMQSSDIFTVGGSVSVNAHGMDHQVGALMRTIRSLQVVMADGSVRRVTPQSDPDFFSLIVGGYGLFGIIAGAELEVADNVIYRTGRSVIPTSDFPTYFAEAIAANPDIGLFYGHLSTAPGDGFMREMLAYTYTRAGDPIVDLPPLGEIGMVKARRLILNLAKEGAPFAHAKWFAEKNIDPLFESCSITRQEALAAGEAGHACFVSRNEPMHDSVPYLLNALDYETDILHEYFVPRENLLPFLEAARTVLAAAGLPVLNASIRVVHKEENFLSYAPEDAFSLVLYINQRADEEGNARMAALTSALIDVALGHGGRFFLPYQLHYTADQLQRSYPMIADFFAAKRRYDPEEIFFNTFYDKYAGTLA